ncbi:tryptophan aminotransferase-related protein 1-like [Setaria viridis]
MVARERSGGMAVRCARRIGVAASVAANLAFLAMYIHRRYFGGGRSDGGGGSGKEITTVEPSKGKPPVTPDSVVNLDQGDPTLYDEFWRLMGGRATITIPGWQTMSYFSDLRWLLLAALFALSPAEDGEPMSVVSPAPYYSSYPSVTNFLNSGLYRWDGDANTTFAGDTCIELVCSPNNPDGGIRKAVTKSKSGKTIHDFAYYWPQYTPITEAADHDIMLFTVSKCTGHAGTRLGWALVKDMEVAQKMTKFIELNTIGVSKDSQLRAAKILKVVCDGYELSPTSKVNLLFHFAQRKMAERWSRLRAVVATSGIFSLPDKLSSYCMFAKEVVSANPPFAWLRCHKDGVEDFESFLRERKIITRGGSKFGVDQRVVRISMLDTDEAFNVFIGRITSLK